MNSEKKAMYFEYLAPALVAPITSNIVVFLIALLESQTVNRVAEPPFIVSYLIAFAFCGVGLIVLLILVIGLCYFLYQRSSELKTELTDTNNELDITKTELNAFKERLDLSETMTNSLESELTETQEDLNNISSELVIVQENLENTQSELSNTQSQLASTKSQLVSAQNEKEELLDNPCRSL